jgi:F0F1-type ATP synthase delta subunit
MKLDSYTRILEMIAELEDEKAAGEAVEKLIRHLSVSGRVKMLPEIARELKKLVARRKSREGVVEVAREKDAKAALAAAKAEGIEAARAHVNHTLISGWRARGDGRLVDRSAKAALVAIYQRIVA